MFDNTCYAPDELMAYWDGELPPGQRIAVETHLKQCAACRGEIIELAGLDELIREVPDPNVSARFVDRTVGRALWAVRLRREIGQRVIPVAASLLICIFGARLYLAARQTPPPQPAMVEHMDLLENMEVVQQLDILSEFDHRDVAVEPAAPLDPAKKP